MKRFALFLSAALFAGGANAATLFFNDDVARTVNRIDADGNNHQVLVTEADNGVGTFRNSGLALDAGDDRMYYNSRNGYMFGADLDGSNPSQVTFVPTTASTELRGLAIDAGNDQLYYTEDNEIRRIGTDGSGETVLVSQASGSGPRDITVDLGNGYMYWANMDTASVYRADLDGTNILNLFSGTVTIDKPYGVEFDLSGGHIYWADFNTDTVKRANIDGSGGVTTILDGADGLVDPFSLAIDAATGELFVGGYDGTIRKSGLDGSGLTTIYSGGSVISDIEILADAVVSVPAPWLVMSVPLLGLLGRRRHA